MFQESEAESILVSETFYHQTKGLCSYDTGPTFLLQGQGKQKNIIQGLLSSYRLIGKCTNAEKSNETTAKPNGVNDKGNLIITQMPQSTPEKSSIERKPTDGKIHPEGEDSEAATKKKRCLII